MRSPLFLFILVLGGALAAQTSTIIPSSAATKDPNYQDYMATGSIDSHGLYLYDSADVGSVGAVWKQVSWRRPHGSTYTNLATTFTMKIIMSNSSKAYTAPSQTFASNHTGTPTTVFNSTISLPANSRGTTWPEPWFPVATFTTSFIHLPVTGGSLVIECLGSNNSQNKHYYCEGHLPDIGQRVDNGASSGCWYHSDGGYNISVTYSSLFVGGRWYAEHWNMPSNQPSMKASINIMGLTGVGGTVFGMTLPIPITKLGFQDICKTRFGTLNQDLLVLTPMTYTPGPAGTKSKGKIRTPYFPIPNNPAFGGITFYQQAFSPDGQANGYDQIYMSRSSKWIIGTGTGPKGSEVYYFGDNTRTTGWLRKGYGLTMLLQ